VVRLASLRDIEEPTIRERPIGVLLIAAASALGGVAVTAAAIELFAGAARYADWAQPKLVGNDLVGMVQVYPEHYLLVGVLLLVIPALYLFGWAIGLVRRRPWARLLGSITGWLFLSYGILALVIPSEIAQSVSANPSQTDRWHLGAGLPWIIIGAVLVWYFGRRVVAYDLGEGDPTIG
jgi:hypothetical protein